MDFIIIREYIFSFVRVLLISTLIYFAIQTSLLTISSFLFIHLKNRSFFFFFIVGFLLKFYHFFVLFCFILSTIPLLYKLPPVKLWFFCLYQVSFFKYHWGDYGEYLDKFPFGFLYWYLSLNVSNISENFMDTAVWCS